MTQEDKNLLMQDLSARLRYGVKFPVEIWDEDAEPGNESKIIDTTLYSINTDGYCKCLDDSEDIYIENVKPWLRPMNSITHKEREVDMEQDLTGAFVLYEESPHNAHMRDVRERAIISCMQGILSNPKWPECSEGSFYKSNVVGNAISYADYLIEQLDKENE